MLQLLGNTRIIQSKEFPVVAGNTVTAEGQAIIQTMVSGVEQCVISAGATDSVFLGFSYGEVFTPLTKSIVETVTVPAAGAATVTLKHAPLTNTQCWAYDSTNAVNQTIGNPVNANEYTIVSTLLTFNVLKAGAVMDITYRYTPTALELGSFEDNISVTSYSGSDYIGSIGVIQQGEVFTDQFDASVDWDSYTSVKVIAGGLLSTNAGTGTEITGAVITHFPTVDLPYVGIRFNAA